MTDTLFLIFRATVSWFLDPQLPFPHSLPEASPPEIWETQVGLGQEASDTRKVTHGGSYPTVPLLPTCPGHVPGIRPVRV